MCYIWSVRGFGWNSFDTNGKMIVFTTQWWRNQIIYISCFPLLFFAWGYFPNALFPWYDSDSFQFFFPWVIVYIQSLIGKRYCLAVIHHCNQSSTILIQSGSKMATTREEIGIPAYVSDEISDEKSEQK